MGTDIYLEWEGKTEQQKQQQAEDAFSIEAGSNGYLRASIHMHNENALLRKLFSVEYWEGESMEPYDFSANYSRALVLGAVYLAAETSGQNFPSEKPQTVEDRNIDEIIKVLETKLDIQISEEDEDPLTRFRDAITWLNSLFAFFELGMNLQKEGKRPFPYISW